MSASLRAFLSGVIDYAGLFPPANLPLDEAVRNYARYRNEPESWMLGRFVVPVGRLAELTASDVLPAEGPRWPFAVLGRVQEVGDFLDVVKADVEAVGRFQREHGGRVAADVMDFRLPDLAAGWDLALAGGFLTLAEPLLHLAGGEPVVPFFEIAAGPAWRDGAATVIAALAGHNRGLPHRGKAPAGFKLRCGGREASAVPTAEQVAFAVVACRAAAVPLKCTAGLHHPVRRLDPVLQTKTHGFLNVFGAGVLAHARHLKEDEVRAIVEDEEAGDFVFDEGGFRWKDFHATTEEVARARREAVVSFGSCNFDEPRDDLRGLGLL
jgi:hypothetical protein